jgi:hypothetical protein
MLAGSLSETLSPAHWFAIANGRPGITCGLAADCSLATRYRLLAGWLAGWLSLAGRLSAAGWLGIACCLAGYR